jgi:hypothetical protein
LRAATADDVDRLVRWHADPEVAGYWDDETFTHDEMLGRLARGGVDAWIVETPERGAGRGAKRAAASRKAERGEVSRSHPPDDDHTAAWVLMEYRSGR